MSDNRPLPTRIWTVEDYYRVKEFYDARGLVFNPALERGSPAAYHVIAQAQLHENRGKSDGNNDLIERLLAGPDDAELSARDLAFLEAYLKQPVSLAAIQQEKRATGESDTNAKRNKLRLIRDFNRNLQSTLTPKPPATAEPAGDSFTPTKAKRSTERGEGRAKLIAALTKHHQYADGGCLNLEPIGNNELARLAGVAGSTASAFFNKEFNRGERGGHTKYRAICRDSGRLADSLKALNGEFSPHELYGRRPAREAERGDKE